MMGADPIGDGGLTAGADGGASGMLTATDLPPEGVGADMKTGDGDLLLVILLRPLRSFRSPSRNV